MRMFALHSSFGLLTLFLAACSQGDGADRTANTINHSRPGDVVQAVFDVAKGADARHLAELCGWAIFVASAAFFLIASYRAGDMWAPRLDHKEALAELVRHFAACVRGDARLISSASRMLLKTGPG